MPGSIDISSDSKHLGMDKFKVAAEVVLIPSFVEVILYSYQHASNTSTIRSYAWSQASRRFASVMHPISSSACTVHPTRCTRVLCALPSASNRADMCLHLAAQSRVQPWGLNLRQEVYVQVTKPYLHQLPLQAKHQIQTLEKSQQDLLSSNSSLILRMASLRIREQSAEACQSLCGVNVL